MKNTILVPVDFSLNSRKALDYAVWLAGKLNMEILLLHAFDPTFAEALRDSYKLLVNEKIEGTPRELQKELGVWREYVNSKTGKLNCRTVFLERELEFCVQALHEKEPLGMIVMGTRGLSRLKGIFMGSHTMNLIEKAKCPVFAIPADHEIHDVRSIVFGTNYMEGDDISIGWLGDLAKTLQAEFAVVHVIDDHAEPGDDECLSENFINGISRKLDYDKIKFHCLKGTDIRASLNDFVKENKADLLAISFSARSLIRSMLKQSLAWDLTYHLEMPLVVFPAMEDPEERKVRLEY